MLVRMTANDRTADNAADEQFRNMFTAVRHRGSEPVTGKRFVRLMTGEDRSRVKLVDANGPPLAEVFLEKM